MNHKVSREFFNDIIKAIGYETSNIKLGEEILDAMLNGVVRFESFSKIREFPIPYRMMGMIFEGEDDPHFQTIKKAFGLSKFMDEDYYGLSSLCIAFDKAGRFKPGKYTNCYIFESIDAFDGIPSDMLSITGFKYIPTDKADSYELGINIFSKVMQQNTFFSLLRNLFRSKSTYDIILEQLYKENYLKKVK